MPIRVRLEVSGDLDNTRKTVRRLVKESPARIASHLSAELKAGDRAPGAVPARPDGITGWPVRTGFSRGSFRPTHDGYIINKADYSYNLEYRSAKWAGSARRYIERRLLAIAEKVRDEVLSGR